MIVTIIFLSFLIISMIYDLKSRQVPNALSLTALIGSGCYAFYQGSWMVVLLTVILIFLSDLQSRKLQITIATILACFVYTIQPAFGGLLFAVTAVWMMWLLGKMGGADVKLLLSALLFTLQPAILFTIFIIGGIQGLIALIRKQTEIPFVVSVFAGSLWYLIGSYY
jgi:Flp pilus assembly protein protease CpaA